MKTIWIIGSQFLRLLFRDRSSIIWMLLVPVLYMFVFGSAFRYRSDPSQSKAYLAVVNNDSGYLSQRLLGGLESENLNVELLDTVPESPPVRLLTIPEGFTDSLNARNVVHLDFSRKTDSNVEAGMTAGLGVRKAAYRMLADLTELAVKGRRPSEASLQRIDSTSVNLISLQTSYAGYHQVIPSGFNHQVPANIVQFTLLMLFIFAGSALIEERKNGLLRRIRIGPVNFVQLFSGKLLGIVLIGLIQCAILLLVGHFVFKVYYGPSAAALVLLVVSFCMAVGSVGLCLGFLVKNPERLVGFSIILGLSMAAMSGCWWPLEISPQWMQKLAMFLPSGLALKGFHQLISFGKGFEAVIPNILGLLLISVIFATVFAVTLSRIDRE